MGAASAYSSETAVLSTVFRRRRTDELWHRVGCQKVQAFSWIGYQIEVEDTIRDFPVFAMIASCCATKDEKTASTLRMAGRAVA